MNNESEYEKEKRKKEDKLVRNEFYYHNEAVGKYEFPCIKKQDIDISKIEFISYVNTKKDDKENSHKSVHFFTYDWLFDKVYENAEEEVEKLKQYYCVLSPDFSVFTNMPLALQIYSIFKNRWCGAYFQSKGIKVIPTVSWGDRKSFEFCFDGIEEGSIVAVSTYYLENCEQDFMLGYNEMMKRIHPSAVLCYDEPFKSMKGNIIEFLPTTYEWTKNLSPKDLVQFKWEKHHRNICGLNKKDFKFFKYEDPWEKVAIEACDVCSNPVPVDQFGQGECKKCGWKQDRECKKKFDEVYYPNRVSLNKARKLYKEGKPLNPNLDEFLEGLFMYSEMMFDYNGKNYGVFREEGDKISFCTEGYSSPLFDSKEDFKARASIDGKLLKDIWSEVKNADFMS